MPCPEFPMLTPLVFLALQIYVRTHSSDQFYDDNVSPVFYTCGEISTGTMYVANTAKLVTIERLRLDRNFSAKADDWSTWKAHTNIAVATGSSDLRGTKRKANASEEAYEALSSIPKERPALAAYLATIGRSLKPAPLKTSESPNAGQLSSSGCTFLPWRAIA